MNVDTMKAGRETDHIIATLLDIHDVGGCPFLYDDESDMVLYDYGECACHCPQYSTDHAAAMLVTAKMNDDGYDVVIELSGDGIVEATFGWSDREGGHRVTERSMGFASLPATICRAAYKVRSNRD